MLIITLLCLVTALPSDLTSDAAEQLALESKQKANQQKLDQIRKEFRVRRLDPEVLRHSISRITRSFELHNSRHEKLKDGNIDPEILKKIEEHHQRIALIYANDLSLLEEDLKSVLKKQRELKQPKFNLRK